ncbi:hypothetical protein [Actinoplanes subtropicus]|uniref:hypothetical protein n=1 Tax=Actinoplanes subtropicus TaxID=543632 RepID=UPI0012F99159|nr:hypothetical protein [Actinoplanes subtropicus]
MLTVIVAAALARQIGERANAFTVVVDGVDQAARPDRLIAEVLLPMIRENVGRNWRF